MGPGFESQTDHSMGNLYICKYCGKEFEKSSQLGGHIIWCKENPNRSGKSNFNNCPKMLIVLDPNML